MENNNANSIMTAAIGFAILILIITVVTSLTNNKEISALEAQSTQLETRLQSLQDTAASVTTQRDATLRALKEELAALVNEQKALREKLDSQLAQLETNLLALVQEKNDKLKAQLQSLKGETTAAQMQQEQQFQALVTQVSQALKAATPSQEESEPVDEQLQSEETASSVEEPQSAAQ